MIHVYDVCWRVPQYVPPNSGHSPDPHGHAMGVWRMGLKRAAYELHFSDELPLVDQVLLNALTKHGRIERSRRELYPWAGTCTATTRGTGS